MDTSTSRVSTFCPKCCRDLTLFPHTVVRCCNYRWSTGKTSVSMSVLDPEPEPAMSDEKKYTDFDLLRAKRCAFVDGWDYHSGPFAPRGPHEEAARRFPIRREVRRKVHLCPGLYATTRPDGALRFVDLTGRTVRLDIAADFNPEQTREILELLQNPTETVEE